VSRDPASAPPRPDLGYLRHRSARRAAATAGGSPLSEFVAGHAHREAPAAAPTVASSLDLDERSVAGQPARPAAAPGGLPPAARPRRPDVARVPVSGRIVLDGNGPSVTLTRLQSGIGALWLEAACPPELAQLRLGCAYRLRGGPASIVGAMTSSRSAPADARLPVLVVSHDRFERIGVDLRQVREVERLMIYGCSESGADLAWAGTIVASTHAGARVEAPLLGMGGGSVGVFLSIYQVDGELVIWSEMLAGTSVRDACRAFGFDDVTWVDERTPLV
jgi:hypothetical protein